MGRMSKHKAAKSAVTKRRKKSGSSSSSTTISTNSSSSGARRTPVSLAESVAIANASIGAASPTGSVSTAGSSTPSSSSAKECEQCGNPTMLDGVSASRVWATSKKQLAANGCQICDFVTFRKSQRPCVHCERAGCEHFCEWCGNGLHTKCARARDEKVNAPNGFCCRKCEAEQADDEEEKDPEAEELGSRCGSCRLPFNATGKEAESDADSDADDDERAKAPEESGFKVNQSVLVENEEVLYNAVITEVDLAGERIKIHFIRWSKSFDNWYAMDDERINESLACDCCNRWFHIGCLPPIKSSGRFKDTTYVCPTCIDDAKHFHNGTRAKAKSASGAALSKASMRKSSVSEDAPPAVPSKRKSSKPIVTSDDEQEAKKPSAAKKKRKLSNASDSPMKKKPELSRAASRSRSKSPDAPTHVRSSATADSADVDNDAMIDDRPADRATDKSAPSSPAQSPSRVAADDGEDDNGTSAASPVASPRSTEAAADASSSVAKPRESKAESDKSDASDAQTDKSPSSDASADAADAQTKVDKPTGAARRKLSSHSVSSLLNSASPNEKPATPPQHSTGSSFSMLDENRRNLGSSFDVLVKTERSHQLPPLPAASTSSSSSRSASSAALKASGSSATAKLEPFTNSSNWSMRAPAASASSMKPSSGRGALSAFDILREVATQSIGGELDAVTTAPAVKPKKERQRASAAKAKALKAEKAAAAAAEKAAAAAKSQSPNGAHGNGPASALSEQERLTKERLQISNSFVDLHFSIRKEMYLKFCLLEEQGLLDRDTAQRLRSLIYPTSDKFQDLKFVYLVNKDLSPLYLTKRLLEVVPAALGGTGIATPQHHAPGGSTPGGGASSVASSPASTTNHTAQPLPTIVPPGLTIPSFSEIIASEKAAALLHQQQQRQHQQLQQHLQQQHQTLQAAALATSGGLELCKKAAAAAAVRPDVLAKELAPLPPSSVMATSSVVTASSTSTSSSLAPSVQSKH